MRSNQTSIGRSAESAVAKYLHKLGYKIVDQNWKTPRCEIDIVAQKDHTAYFVEVKYRATDKQGVGFEYITIAKLRQMALAAEIWASHNSWSGSWQLLAASVSGDNFEQIELVEID